jgi:hypothetical protein
MHPAVETLVDQPRDPYRRPVSAGVRGSRCPVPLTQHRSQRVAQAINLGLQHGDLALGHRLRGVSGFGHPQPGLSFGLGELLLTRLNLSVGLHE